MVCAVLTVTRSSVAPYFSQAKSTPPSLALPPSLSLSPIIRAYFGSVSKSARIWPILSPDGLPRFKPVTGSGRKIVRRFFRARIKSGSILRRIAASSSILGWE